MKKIITLFSGVGMQELGFKTAGLDYKLINYCEFEKKPSLGFSLFHNVSEDLNLGDITQINEDEYYRKLKNDSNEDIDIIISSFPCQAFSASGRRKGFGDPTRGTLFFDTMRLVNKIKPSIVIFENVKGLTNHDNGNTLSVIEEKVEESGYKIFHQILNSNMFDIPQNRERWFAVCVREDLCDSEFYFPEGKMTTKCVADVLDPTVKDRKVKEKLIPILEELRNGTREYVDYKSYVGLKKIYDGVKQGDFKSSYMQNRIYSIYGLSSTLVKSNMNTFVELNGRLTAKERMRLMGVEDKYTQKLIDAGFLESEIDSIAGNGLVVNVFDALIKEVYKYMGWIEGENIKPSNYDIIQKKKKKKEKLSEDIEPNCELEYKHSENIIDDDDFWDS